MRKFFLWVGLFTLAGSGAAQAASYLDRFGVVHDPILTTGGAVHSYSGNNLHSYADLSYANLSGAYLYDANLNNTDLSYANLSNADLSNSAMSMVNLLNADLTGANLSGVQVWDTWLEGADLSGADLSGANELGYSLGSAYYNAQTDFTSAWDGGIGGTLFDPVAAGWTFVPEPSTALLLGIGLAGLGMRRRQRTRTP